MQFPGLIPGLGLGGLGVPPMGLGVPGLRPPELAPGLGLPPGMGLRPLPVQGLGLGGVPGLGMQPGLIRPPLLPGGPLPPGIIARAPVPVATVTKSMAVTSTKAPFIVAPPKAAPAPVAPVAPAAPVVPEKPQPCTVYVGRISSEASDEFVKSLLEKCGTVTKWNRAADPNTAKLTSFGFCDFEDAQGVWRALELLHDKQLCDKKLLVKCEEKAKQTIDKWKDSRREDLARVKAEREGKAVAKGMKLTLTDVELEVELRKANQDLLDELTKLLAEKNAGFEVKPEPASSEKEKEEKEASKAMKDKEEKEAKDKESKEKEKADKKEEDKKESNKRKPSPPIPREQKFYKDRQSDRDRERRRDREKDDDDDDDARVRGPAPVSRHYRPSRREREREQRVRDRDKDVDKEYSYRLRDFERGEDKRIRNLKQDLRDLDPPEPPTDREKRKFTERDLDFDDSDMKDWKRRREDKEKDRRREHEKDAADKEAEIREMEEEKENEKKAEERKKREAIEAEEKAKRDAEDEKRRQEEAVRKAKADEERQKREAKEQEEAEERHKKEAEKRKEQEAAAAKLLQSVQQEILTTSVPPKAASPAAVAVANLFKEGEDLDEQGNPRKHKPLTRLDTPVATEVRLRDDQMKSLIQQVPTDKAKAFAFEIDWQIVHDNGIIEKKLRPWVTKKVTEYLGNEEQGMIEFIMRKVSSHTAPDAILAELEGFLDEEAENFTLKMWRMLIFEVLRVKAK